MIESFFHAETGDMVVRADEYDALQQQIDGLKTLNCELLEWQKTNRSAIEAYLARVVEEQSHE